MSGIKLIFHKSRVWQWLCYIVIGLLTFGMTNILLYVLRRMLKMPVRFSVMATYAVVTACHFLLHNNLTFKDSRQSLRDKMRGHLAVAVLNYFIGVAISTAMLKYIVDNHIVATVCSTAATFLFGFVLLDRFVYKMNNGGKDR